MVYTEKEIVKEYKSSRSPKAQISILAELNGVTSEEIKEILIRNGALVENKKEVKVDKKEVKENKKEVREDKKVEDPVEIKNSIHEEIKIPLTVFEAITIHKRNIEKNIEDLKEDLNEIDEFLNKYKTFI